jgi:uncharacterized membrane protein YbhN (UPF0104 family)
MQLDMQRRRRRRRRLVVGLGFPFCFLLLLVFLRHEVEVEVRVFGVSFQASGDALVVVVEDVFRAPEGLELRVQLTPGESRGLGRRVPLTTKVFEAATQMNQKSLSRQAQKSGAFI